MNKKTTYRIAASLVGLTALCAPAFLFAKEPSDNQPPKADPIQAELMAPTTMYSVHASDPDGDELSYDWRGDIACGTFQAQRDSTAASWTHPNGTGRGECPHEDGMSHEGTISVRISDGRNAVLCAYDGSESGDGPACEVITSVMGDLSPVSYARRNFNPYMFWYWLWIPIVVAIVYGFWWFNQNGLFVHNGSGSVKDPCVEQRRREAAARARRDAAKRALEEKERLKRVAEDADRRAREAEREAERAARAAGGRWSAHGSTDWEGQHTEVHREGWQDKKLGEKADAAAASAGQAREAAQAARAAFDGAGGDSGLASARKEAADAEAEWEKADAALKVCLHQVATPKPQPPQPPQPPTAPPPPVTPPPPPPPTEPTGPVVSTPPQTEVRRVCSPGDRRNRTSRTETVRLLDLNSVRLMQDRIYSDAGNEAMKFVDYLQTLKDLFNLGKRLKGGVEGYLGGSLSGAAEAVDLPDFYTWYDKGIDLLTKSMHELYQIMQDKQRLGEYWLEYNYKQITLTCTSQEVCENNRWVKHCELTVEDNGMHTQRTNSESVHDPRELQPAIRKLFTQLRNRFNPDRTRAQQFTDACNRCQ